MLKYAHYYTLLLFNNVNTELLTDLSFSNICQPLSKTVVEKSLSNTLLCSCIVRPLTARLQICRSSWSQVESVSLTPFSEQTIILLGMDQSVSKSVSFICLSRPQGSRSPAEAAITARGSEWMTRVTAPLLQRLLCVAAENRTQLTFAQQGCINTLCPQPPCQ